MKILMTNAYSSRNKGDAAIVLGMLADLRSRQPFREAEFRLSTADYPEDAGAYPCRVVSSFHVLKRRLTRWFCVQGLGFLMIVFPWSLLWAWTWRRWHVDLWAPRPWRELFLQYAESDLIVAVGGGYLYTRSAWRGNLMLLITVFSFWFGHALGKPVYLYAQSIGPFKTGLQESMVRFALRRLRLVIVREEISLQFVSTWRLCCPVRMAADAAFLLPTTACFPPTVQLPPASRRVGVTVRRWSTKRSDQEAFEQAVARFIDWLTTLGETLVVLIPQVTFTAWKDDDREVMRRVHAQVQAKGRVILVEDELSPFQVKGLCGAMDFFIGTRMHSNIFALSSGVPTIAISYQAKSAGIMRQLDLERWVVPWEEVTPQRLQVCFEDLLQNEEAVRAALPGKIGEMVRSARQSGQSIAEDYKGGRDKTAPLLPPFDPPGTVDKDCGKSVYFYRCGYAMSLPSTSRGSFPDVRSIFRIFRRRWPGEGIR